MPSNSYEPWRRTTVAALIDEAVLIINDGYRAKNSELGKPGVPFARAGNVRSRVELASADHLRLDRLDRVGNKISQAGDVVFTSKGTVGRFAFVQPGDDEFVYSPQLCFWRVLDERAIDPEFLYFWLFGGSRG
jgi:type I restriction enzyme S subunit